MLPVAEESRGYDFQDPENADRWRGLFVSALRKVLEQVHPTLTAEESALQYVESLCLRLLAMLCAAPSPLTVQDVEERVARTFPTPLDKWALADARDAVTQRRRRLQLPLDRVHHMLLKEVLLYKVDMSVSVFMTAILEYVSADILKLAGNFVKKISQKSGYETVTSRDIKTAMCADKVLMDMFYQDSELALAAGGAGGAGGERGGGGRRGSLTYAELVRDLLADEKHFLRELHLIIRVFKDELEKIVDKDSKDIAAIFGNIVDIYELTVTLLGNLEDACEMSQDSPTPYIASCFEELAEVEEFRAYLRYASIVTSRESRDALQRIVDDPELSERLDTAGHGFRLAVKYYLPRLLLAPVGHVFLYHSYVLALLQIATLQEDRESFKQVECNLHPITKQLMKALGNGPKMEATLRMAPRARRQWAVDKCNELARIVDNWDDKDIGQCCNEFIREDTLSKIGPGKRIAERRAYLFDGLLLLCKPITSLVGVNSSNAGAGGAQQLKLKEKLHVRRLELVDRPDTEEGRHMVELWPRVGPAVVLACASAAEKRRWMCDLVMLNTKPMLDRSLDSILVDLERRHPLQLPPATLYRFAVPDAPDNIVLEDHPHSPHKLIKGATLLKLVERLTYHVHADLNLVRTFLTTYRSFCSPGELLSLLIERFHIPEPGEVYDAVRPAENIESVAHSDIEKISKNTVREDWKRYRKEFQQPVKFRVINVLRHWVDQHFYDFERDPALLERLRQFLLSVDGKPMKKWVQSVLKTLDRKSAQSAEEALCGVSHVFDRPPPPVVRHLADPARYDWHPLTLHPLELARQLTLLELQLYRQVKPSELVGAVWTKKDKTRTSPNLLRLIRHTTNFTHWMAKWIVESENLEERAGVVCRLVEVACALRDLNNFNGVLAVVSACGLSAVHRLKATFDKVPPRLIAHLKQFQLLNADHFRQYKEQLRSINPPCVPFCGIYLTNILHIEEGNLDYLPNSELINFSKWRKVAEITGEIQQYQNQPYCLTVEPATRAFLESLDPFPELDENEITNYLYSKSLEIEPRPPNKTIPRAPRKYPELSLKPVKWWAKRHDQPAAAGNNTSNDDTISVTSQLSPTNSAWDGASVHSLPVHDDSRGSKSDSLVSPRLERCGAQLSQLSLFDKTLGGLFTNPHARAKEGARNEPPSPRDRHSPRHDRQGSACGGGGERKPLSPRGAIVDAELFYCSQERVPPLLPRNSTTLPAAATASQPGTCHQQHQPTSVSHQPGSQPAEDERPPALPRRDPNHSSSSEPPEPPDRPLPSPKHDALRMPAMSPKRSPAPPPPPSPLAASAAAAATDRMSAFRFPASPPAAGPAAASTPAPHTPPHPGAWGGPPPPLPPRRRRDSAAPHTPAPPHPHQPAAGATAGAPSGAPSSGGSGGSGGPPPLPPRPAPAPSLLRPAHSTILQRRHTQSASTAAAPRLPPKPPPALAPRP